MIVNMLYKKYQQYFNKPFIDCMCKELPFVSGSFLFTFSLSIILMNICCIFIGLLKYTMIIDSVVLIITMCYLFNKKYRKANEVLYIYKSRIKSQYSSIDKFLKNYRYHSISDKVILKFANENSVKDFIKSYIMYEYGEEINEFTLLYKYIGYIGSFTNLNTIWSECCHYEDVCLYLHGRWLKADYINEVGSAIIVNIDVENYELELL